MRRIYYSGGSVTVSDPMSSAVLRYARALSHARTADLVAVPSVSIGNRVGFAHFLLGPASQLLSVPAEDTGVALDDAHAVEVLESRAERLTMQLPQGVGNSNDAADNASASASGNTRDLGNPDGYTQTDWDV